MRLIVLIGLTTTLLSAQSGPFTQFAATDDGQTIYVVSKLVLTAAPPPTPPMGGSNSSVANLFRIGTGGIQLLSASANSPRVSGDGRVLAFTDPNFCTTLSSGGTSCGQEGKLLGAPDVDLGAGAVQLSRNGRWALVSSTSITSGTATVTLIDNNS